MKDTDYAYAVARIRANEQSLLTSAELEQLALAPDADAVRRLLEARGWLDAERAEETGEALDRKAQEAWQLLRAVAPDIRELDFLIIRHDFHNMKAALKSFVYTRTSGREDRDAIRFMLPSVLDPQEIRRAVYGQEARDLPEFARDAIRDTYDVLVRTMDGQLADIRLDALALDRSMELASATGSVFLRELAELQCAAADMKTALRAARTGRDEAFLETALSRAGMLDRPAIIRAAADGEQALLAHFSSTRFGEAADSYRISPAAFEKWWDDRVMAHAQKAKYISLGVAPLAAYHIAADTEIRSVRMILASKRGGFPPEILKERLRMAYV